MQVISKNKNKESGSGEADIVDPIICIGEISGYIEGKHIGESEMRTTGVWNSKRILSRYKKEFGGGDKEIVKVAELKELE